MEVFSNLASLVVPKWVKVTVVLILTILIILYLTSAVMGILDKNRSGWLEAGAYILGTFTPLLIVVLFVSFSESGTKGLTLKTSHYLTRVIPDRTVLLLEPQDKFQTAAAIRKRLHDTPVPEVKIQASANMTTANYIIDVPPSNLVNASPSGSKKDDHKVVLLRLELNATKLNMNLMFSPDLLKETISGSSEKYDIKNIFPHSIEGAEKEGYWFNNVMITRRINGKEYMALVAVKKLANDFLTSPIKKLDLAQDLMLMIRSALNERPELFEDYNSFYDIAS